MPDSAQQSSGGMSLYANLLDTGPGSSAGASISRAPVLFKQSDDRDEASKKPLDPALRFQPIIRRPQAKQVKPKASFPKAPVAAAATPAVAAAAAPSQPNLSTQQQRSKLADWAPTEEDEYIYGSAAGQKRERGGRRQKKKKRFEEQRVETDWDEIYDPARPTNIEEYLRSDEKIREVQDWKAVLYAHRRKKQQQRRQSTDTDMTSDEENARPSMSNQFAPPPSYGFAPPPPPAEPSPAPVAETAEEAYARRLALSSSHPPPPPPPPPTSETTISRAPVRYSPPPPPPPADDPSAIDTDKPDVPPPGGQLPSKSGFASRIMSKYGWTKGAGLGAEGSGITTALRVQVEKRKRRPDAEGGGFVDPKGGRGRIIAPKSLASKQEKESDEDGKEGRVSTVVVLRDMLEGMDDLRGEVEDGLTQEIGEECGEKYGRVERVVVDVEGRRVYIKFTDGVSALRAVGALEGRVFNGNVIRPGFFDEERFERGEYERD